MTALSADVVDSSLLGDRLDPGTFDRLMASYEALARRVLDEHGCGPVKFSGDGVMAVFGVPTQQQDDALRAVRAAVGLHAAITAFNAGQDPSARLRLRTGLSTGEALVVGGASDEPRSQVLNIAAKIQESALEGQVLLDEQTYQSVRDLIVAEPVSGVSVAPGVPDIGVYRLESMRADSEHPQEIPFVGRRPELQLLGGIHDRMVQGRGHLIVILGQPGVGKTRLVDEFLSGVHAGLRIFRSECRSYGEDIAYQPIAEILKKALSIAAEEPSDIDPAHLAELVGDDVGLASGLGRLFGLPVSAGESVDPARVARGILRLIARERPVVLLIDNLHLAQPAMLKFLEGASESLRDAPVLLMCVANPELAETWRQWGENVYNATSIVLDPLLGEEADELIGGLLLGGSVDAGILEKIRDQTGGNPLLVKQFVTMLRERGFLRLEGTRWVAYDLDSAPSTPRIDAVLGSRLDVLPELERIVIERAALIGKQFSLDELLVLLDEDQAPVLEALKALVGKELLQEDGPGQLRFGFPHALIRDVAYRRIAPEERARLHEQYAEWRSVQSNGSSNPNAQQTLGLHYDRASGYWSGILGPEAGKKQARLASLAGTWLLKAGELYLQSGNIAASLEVLGRATELLPESDQNRPRAFLRLAEATRDSGGGNPADAYHRTLRAARGKDSHIELYARLGLVEMQWATHIQTDEAKGHGELDSIIQAFENPLDQRGLAEAWRLRAYIHAATGASERALDAAEHARRLAAELEDERLEARIRRIRDIILYWGPWSCDLIEPELEESVSWARSHGMVGLKAAATGVLARIAAMRGADDRARALLRVMQSVTEHLYETLTPSSAAMSEGLVELYANDFAAAEKPLRRAYNQLRGTSRIDVAALLGRVLVRIRRWDEVELLAAECQRAAGGSNHDTEVKRTELQALVFASRGEYEVAQEYADTAVRLGERSQHFDTHAEPLVTKAEVLRQQRALGPARSAAEEALQRYQAKGDRQSVARVERLLVTLQE